MKTIILLSFLMISGLTMAQFVFELKGDQLEVTEGKDEGKRAVILKCDTDSMLIELNETQQVKGCDEVNSIYKEPDTLTCLIYYYDCDKKELHISQREVSMTFDLYVDENGFNLGKRPDASEAGKIAPYLMPYPKFTSELTVQNKKNRFLIIDAQHSAFGMYKDSEGTMKAKAVRSNESVGVLLTNYHFSQMEKVKVTVAGITYAYDSDISDLYNKDEDDPKETNETDKLLQNEGANAELVGTEKDDRLKIYFQQVLDSWKSVSYLSKTDIVVLENYRDSLRKLVGLKVLSKEEADLYFSILEWQPKYVSLTPIALAVPSADEVEISVKLTEKGQSEENYSLGQYKVRGGFGVSVNTNLFFTGLRNNKVYVDSVAVSDTLNEFHAMIENKNQMSLGVGLNGELSFRTGCSLRPTLNVGFFVPFEEDLTPYVALGPGLSLGNKDVKLSISGGVAFGKVNAIAEQYADRDLSGMTDLMNADLTSKVWSKSWQFNIGLSYQLGGK